MIIDSHMHLWGRLDGPGANRKRKPLKNGIIMVGGKMVQAMPTWFADCRNTAELALAAFDDAGVDAAVVTQEYMDGNQNSYLLKVKKAYPERFFVHGLVDFTKPATLKREFASVVRQGFRGIKCPAAYLPGLNPPVRLDEPALMAVWEQMEQRTMVLSIDLAGSDVQVPEMKRVIRTFPKLKVAVGHWGLPGRGNWMAQIRLAEFDNVYIESGGIVWLFRHEGPPFKKAQAKIKQAVRAVGAEKLMWGSDYPRTMVDFTYRQSLEFVTDGCDFFSDKERAAFLGKNAARLYGFKYKQKNRQPHRRITGT